MDHALRPDSSLSEQLDFSEVDDRLVATVAEYRRRHLGADVRLLTHDTGPMMAARMVDVPIEPIPDDWLLPPEPSAVDRKIATLEAEVRRLTADRAAFAIECSQAPRGREPRSEFSFLRVQPLLDNEITSMMKRIEERIPLITRSIVQEGSMLPRLLLSATPSAIEDYRSEHQSWLDALEETLTGFHLLLQAQVGLPRLSFRLSSTGTKPGSDVLISFEASGDFLIIPPLSAKLRKEVKATRFPPPPQPPERSDSTRAALSLYTPVRTMNPSGISPLTRHATRDANRFYFKPSRPPKPTRLFEYECKQWRHGVEPAEFSVDVVLPEDALEASGAIHCAIHAENLATPERLTIPVHVTTTTTSSLEAATAMVENLVKRYGRTQE